ncbi:DUF6767 domain-containing protein [Microlunatus sp. Gsoil 973]|uniref:DUF6767 domain-containing protein n=1 Tax=Microlunatus sp. Gsoil 973 TaxID=2672569 RepID=UPI0012B4E2FE|nr:DUF6767 domain-containing protein [Microlunatus sp. Gsoil 973]QGN33076.1 hypothetical protein GJV80_09935 [Microlunatus sp. Gsoil 973]
MTTERDVGGRRRSRPNPRCPIRDEPCNLCFPGATGPQDCGLVYLVQSDPELRAALHQTTLANRRAAGTPTAVAGESQSAALTTRSTSP